MDRKQRRELKRKIQWAYKIHRIVETMPKRYRDMILGSVVEKTDWNTMQEMYYYSERQMRNILNDALEEFQRRLQEREIDA